MKSRLKISLLLFVFAGLALGFGGCNKYPEGPSLSLRTKTHRVAGTWRVDSYRVNGDDYTTLVQGYTETYSKDGNYSYSWPNAGLNGAGTWRFENDKEEIQIIGTSNQSDIRLIILKLEEKAFWYYYMDGADKKEFHLIQ